MWKKCVRTKRAAETSEPVLLYFIEDEVALPKAKHVHVTERIERNYMLQKSTSAENPLTER